MLQSISMRDIFSATKQSFQRGGFLCNISTLFAGNISAQLLGLFTAPIITRLYSPEHFGQVAIIITLYETLAVIACLRYETAIVLPKDDNDALNLVALCLLVSFGFSLIISLFFGIMSHPIARWMNIEQVRGYLWIVPFGVFLNGVNLCMDYWNTRVKRFYLTAIAKVAQPLVGSTVKIASGLMIGSTSLWLIIGNVSGFFIVAAILFIVFMSKDHHQFIPGVSKANILARAKEFKDFPRYNGVKTLINSFSQKLPVFLFASFYSVELVAFYSLARITLTKPITLISQSCEKVFLQRASEIYFRNSNFDNYLKKTIFGLSAIGIIPFGILAIGGEWIFSIFFGSKWAAAGFYAQLLTPWLFFLFINPPAKQVIIVRQKLLYDLNFNIVLLIARACAIVAGKLITDEPWVAILLFSLVGAAGNLYLIQFAFKISRNL